MLFRIGGLLVSNFLKLSFINNVKTGRWEKKKLNGEFSDILSRLDRTIDRDPIYKVKRNIRRARTQLTLSSSRSLKTRN